MTAYMGFVPTLIARLLLLASLLIMPLGMQPALASAHGVLGAAAMPAEHCEDMKGKADGKGGIAECTMACAAALPAVPQPVAEGPDAVGALLADWTPAPPRSVLHEIATPPPRIA